MRVVVVGAGVIGLACAYELLQDGHDVVLLDRAQAGMGASWGNAAKIAVAETTPVPAPGMVLQGLRWMLRADSPLYIKPSLSPPFIRFMAGMARHCTVGSFRSGLEANLRAAQRALALFDEWTDAGVEFEQHQRGVVLGYDDDKAFEMRLRYQDLFTAYDEPVEVLDRAGLERVEPALSERVHRGLYYPADRQIEPESLNTSLAQHIRAAGGELLEGVEVTGFERTGDRVTGVLTRTGRHAADGVVLAAGVWTEQLARQLGVALPIQPGKGYSLDYIPPAVQLRTSLTLDGPHVAITPLDGMLRIAGTMEFSGFSTTVNPTRIGALKRTIADYFVGWDPDAPHRPAWAGMRPMTPDGLPIVGALTPQGNVWVATGHAMLGLTLAPATARDIRDQVRGRPAKDPATSVERFAKAVAPR